MPRETEAQRIERKAGQIREALIKKGVVYTVDPDLDYAELPEQRKERWREMARTYCRVFR